MNTNSNKKTIFLQKELEGSRRVGEKFVLKINTLKEIGQNVDSIKLRISQNQIK